MSQIKIVHIITGLDPGGAEKNLFNLLASQDALVRKSEVISLKNGGSVGESIRELGIPVHSLDINARFPNPVKFLRLINILRASDPDIVHTWMYHANLIGGLAAKLAGKSSIIWGIRQDLSEMSWVKPATLLVIKMGTKLSASVPRFIVLNSMKAVDSHSKIGFEKKKFIFIPNGVNTNTFAPDKAKRKAVRKELELKEDDLLIGFFARYHPIKDHQLFLRAAEIALKRMPNIHFILCGTGIQKENSTLSFQLKSMGLQKSVHLLGLRNDIPRLLNALDIYTNNSISEGFPSVVAEAMSTALPCVVVDVGDVARLVGETGKVLANRDPYEISNAWIDILKKTKKERIAIGQAARHRIVNKYNNQMMLDSYEQLYQDLVRLNDSPHS